MHTDRVRVPLSSRNQGKQGSERLTTVSVTSKCAISKKLEASLLLLPALKKITKKKLVKMQCGETREYSDGVTITTFGKSSPNYLVPQRLLSMSSSNHNGSSAER